MAGVPEPHPNARQNLYPGLVVVTGELVHRGKRIAQGIDRFHQLAAALPVAAVEALDLGLLDVARVRQHDRAQVDGGHRGVDGALETEPRKLRQQAAMVDMGVGQHDCVDICRPERERLVVQFPQGFRALKQAAVDQHGARTCFQAEAGSSDRSGSAVERKLECHVILRCSYAVGET